MGRKPGPIVRTELEMPEDQPAAAAEITPVAPEVTDSADESLRTFIASFGNNPGKVTIYKYDRNGNAVFCGAGLPGVVDEEWLQFSYGAGRYQVRLTDDKGRYLRSRIVHIAAGPADDATYNPPMAVPPAAPAAVQPFSPSPPMDGAGEYSAIQAEISGMRDLMMKLIDKVVDSRGGGGSSLVELTAAIQAVKEMSAPASPADQVKEIIGVLKTGIEIGQTGTITGDKPGWLGIVQGVAEALAPVAASLMRRPGQPAPAVHPPSVAPANPPAAIAQPADPRLDLLRRGINYLKPKARAGKAWETYVDFILDNMEDTEWLPFLELLDKPYEEIAQVDPDLTTPLYRPWFESFLMGLRNAIAESNASAEAGPDGDASNPGDNAKPHA